MEDNLQCMMSPVLAKQLILKGYVVKDIKPNKNEYCIKHNINLLRIPYTQFHRLEEICKENNII